MARFQDCFGPQYRSLAAHLEHLFVAEAKLGTFLTHDGCFHLSKSSVTRTNEPAKGLAPDFQPSSARVMDGEYCAFESLWSEWQRRPLLERRNVRDKLY